MKTVCLFFAVISCVVLVHGVDSASSSNQGRQQTSTPSSTNAGNHLRDANKGAAAERGKQKQDTVAHKQPGRRPNADKISRGGTAPETNRARRYPSSRGRSAPTNAIAVREPDLHNSSARNPSIENAPGRNNAAVRRPAVAPRTVSLPSNVRHRAPNPPMIGGLVNSKTASQGTINGSRMRRSP